MRIVDPTLEALLTKRESPLTRVHLLDLEFADTTRLFVANIAGVYPAILGGGTQTYKPWLLKAPAIRDSRSLRADGGSFAIQRVSGNTVDRDADVIFEQREVEGALAVYRRYYTPHGVTGRRFDGTVTSARAEGDRWECELLQLIRPAALKVFDRRYGRACVEEFGSGSCGYRAGDLFVPLTTADVHTSTTIGKSGGGGLGLEPDFFKGDAEAWILEGTGSVNTRLVSSHTADVFTVPAWPTTPDATSKFILTGAGATRVGASQPTSVTLTSLTKTGAGWTADAFKGDRVAFLANAGAAQSREIASNTADTIFWRRPLDVAISTSTWFVVVFRTCPLDRASCSARGMLPRFSGVIHLTTEVTRVGTPVSLPPGVGSGDGGRHRDRGERLGPDEVLLM